MPVSKPALYGGAAATLVVALTAGWLGLGLGEADTQPSAPPTTASSPVTQPPASATPSPAAEAQIAASAPLQLRIPSIGLDGTISEYGQDLIDQNDGFDPPELTTIAWDTTIAGGLAGTDASNTVYLYGHSAVEPAVFNDLKDLAPGAVASIDTANGRLCYVEQKALQLVKSEYKTNDELTDAIPNRLVLVSCYRPIGYDPNETTVENIVVILQLDQAQTNSGC